MSISSIQGFVVISYSLFCLRFLSLQSKPGYKVSCKLILCITILLYILPACSLYSFDVFDYTSRWSKKNFFQFQQPFSEFTIYGPPLRDFLIPPKTYTFFQGALDIPKDGPRMKPHFKNIFVSPKFPRGYLYNLGTYENIKWAIGVHKSTPLLPALAKPSYGSRSLSYSVFLQIELRN